MTDLAGLPPIARVEGRSLKADWSPGNRVQDEPAYVESLYGRLSFGWAPLHGWRERGRMFIDAPAPELYDLENDPAESVNLAQAQATEVARLQRLVRAAAATAAPAVPVAGSRDVLHRLQGLGYISGGAVARPSLRDPKELLGVAERLEKAMACERTSPATAIDEFRAVLAQDPANPLARRRLGLVLAGERRFEEALAELRPLVAAGNAGAEGLTLVADCLRLTGIASEALEVAREASAADPRMAEGANAEGRALVALNRPAEARVAFERALALAPDDPSALDGLADLAIAGNDLVAARRHLEALRLRDGDAPDTLVKLGKVLVRLGDLPGAIELFRAVVSRQPQHADALLSLGGVLAKGGRPADAIPLFERAIAAGAAGPLAWNGLGVARLETGDRAGAARAFRESLKARADQPNIAALLRNLESGR